MKTKIRGVILSLMGLALLPGIAGAATVTLDAMRTQWLQGQDPAVSVQRPTRDIRVELWTDGEDDEVLRPGEEFTLNFQANADLFVVVYKVDVEGRVEVLWPESRFSDGFVYGNHAYSIPRPGQPGRLRVGEVKGVEYVEAVASSYPFDLRALGIDFRFEPDRESWHDYYVDGDPFLALNDINYAITGLEEDVDYVVTDFMQIYVKERVEYARYSCNQCHLDDGGHAMVHPYVDTCTRVEVRSDWGWHNSWYVSFGWYPLYYEPAFYYWDSMWSRPYWYAWYPVPYRWNPWVAYTRPYPVYWWRDSGVWRGDYATRWSKRRTRSVPLYDVARVRSRTSVLSRDGVDRHVTTMPRSVTDRGGAKGRKVDRDSLVRNSSPPSRRGHTDVSGRKADPRDRGIQDPGRRGRGKIRTDRRRAQVDSDRHRIVSKRPAKGSLSRGGTSLDRRRGGSSESGRRWTRPEVKNKSRRSDRDGGALDRSRSQARDRGRDRSSGIDRPSRRQDRSAPQGRSVDRPSRRGQGRDGSVAPTRRSSGNKRGYKGDSKGDNKSGRGGQPHAKPTPRSSGSKGRSQVKPAPSRSSGRGQSRARPTPTRRSAPPRPAARGSQGSGGGSRSRGGRGGGRG